MPVGESPEKAPEKADGDGDVSGSADASAAEDDAAVEDALRELFTVPGAAGAGEPMEALISWRWRLTGMP
jgi:hypothetical protein